MMMMMMNNNKSNNNNNNVDDDSYGDNISFCTAQVQQTSSDRLTLSIVRVLLQQFRFATDICSLLLVPFVAISLVRRNSKRKNPIHKLYLLHLSSVGGNEREKSNKGARKAKIAQSQGRRAAI